MFEIVVSDAGPFATMLVADRYGLDDFVVGKVKVSESGCVTAWVNESSAVVGMVDGEGCLGPRQPRHGFHRSAGGLLFLDHGTHY